MKKMTIAALLLAFMASTTVATAQRREKDQPKKGQNTRPGNKDEKKDEKKPANAPKQVDAPAVPKKPANSPKQVKPGVDKKAVENKR